MWTAVTLTPAERRGALTLLAIFALGAAHDLWDVHMLGAHPPPAASDTVAAAPEPVVPDASGAAPAGAAAAPASAPVPPAPLDLNRATAAELDALPGVGPVLAGRIVDYRRQNGAFRSVDELLAVRGVGPKSFARLRNRLRIGNPAPAPDTAGPGPGRAKRANAARRDAIRPSDPKVRAR